MRAKRKLDVCLWALVLAVRPVRMQRHLRKDALTCSNSTGAAGSVIEQRLARPDNALLLLLLLPPPPLLVWLQALWSRSALV